MDDDAIEKPRLGRRNEPVAPHDLGIGDAEPFEPRPRLAGETLETLERHDLLDDLRQDGCRIARARADLEDAMAGHGLESLDHARHEGGFGHGLAAADRQRHVAQGEIGIAMRNEPFARHFFERAQDVEIADAAGAQAEQEGNGRLRPCPPLANRSSRRVAFHRRFSRKPAHSA